MLNTLLLNTQTLNSNGSTGGSGSGVVLSFNGYNFQGVDTITQSLDRDNAPSRDLETVRLPRANGRILLSHFWDQRRVSISGTIVKATKELLDAELHAMKLALSVPEASLLIPDGTNQLVMTATWSNPESSFDRADHYAITYCKYKLDFVTTEKPFLYTPAYIAASFFSQTNLNLSEQVDPVGNAEMQPVFIMIFTAASNITHIKITNNTTGEQIEFNTTVTAGDVIIVDSENLTVQKNGADLDYDGFFLSLINGTNSFTILMTGATPTATYDLAVKWKNAYL